jgi:aldose 1-epimerase
MQPQPAYPWRIALSVVYELEEGGLRVTLNAENRSPEPAPFGAGFHPYVTLGGSIDVAHLTIPARRRLVTDERGLPIGDEPVADTAFDFLDARRIGGIELDTAFFDLVRGVQEVAEVALDDPATGRRVAVWAGPGFHHLMVYTGDTLLPPDRRRRGIAIEPMTCPPNALATGTDVIVLERGEPWVASWGITARRTS